MIRKNTKEKLQKMIKRFFFKKRWRKSQKKNTFFNKLFPITFELFFRQLNKRINFFFPSIFFLSNGYVILVLEKKKRQRLDFFSFYI